MIFRRHEDSLPCSKEAATEPYSEPNVFSLHPHTQFCKIHFSVIPASIKVSEITEESAHKTASEISISGKHGMK